MTDFFADLEQELRAAHPRRSRPVVPVKPPAVAACVVLALIAVASFVPGIEREVATQPTPGPQPTAEVQRDCQGKIVDERVPEAILDRFAILRGDGPAAHLPQERIPFEAASVARQSLRLVDGPNATRFVVAVVRMADAGCEPSEQGVCIISLQTEDAGCLVPGSGPQIGYVVDERPDGRRVVAVLAADEIPRVSVRTDVVHEVDLKANTGFHVLPTGDEQVRVAPAESGGSEETFPLNCAGEPDVGRLRSLPVFREPATVEATSVRTVFLPAGWHRALLDEGRVVDVAEWNTRYLAFPAIGPTCRTGVCMWREGTEKTVCEALPAGKEPAIVLSHMTPRGHDGEIAGLVNDGVGAIRIGNGQQAEIAGGFFHARAAEGYSVFTIVPDPAS